MRILTWNVNGVRSLVNKYEPIDYSSYDIVCFNETKVNAEVDILSDFMYRYHSYASKKGYSGVSIYSRIEPIKRLRTVDSILSAEGRLVVLEYSRFILVAMYQPNSGHELKRIHYRSQWDQHFRRYINRLTSRKSVIIVGDMNVANEEIDIFKPSIHHKSAGFTDMERDNFKSLLSVCDMVDVWRSLHPRKIEYTYFDYRSRARVGNRGWRLDYILVSKSLESKVDDCYIIHNAIGSDHLPVVLVI